MRFAGHDRSGGRVRWNRRPAERFRRPLLDQHGFGSARVRRAPVRQHGLLATAPAASRSGNPSDLASSLKKLNQLWADQGCKTALAGFGSYVSAYQTNKLQAVAAIPGAVQQIRAGAQQTRVPEAADAMNKMATDLQTMVDQAKQGQSPNKGPVQNDFQVMGNTCAA